MNICGSACRRPGSPKFRDPGNDGHAFLLFQVNTEPDLAPWMVGVQEVCAVQSAWFAFNMAPGYQQDFTYTLWHDPTCNGNYGNHMATVGPNDGPLEVFLLPPSTYHSGSYPAEARKVQCRDKLGWGFEWRACNTHLVPSDLGSPTAQAPFVRMVAGLGNSITTGDFSIPNTSDTDGWSWPQVWEVDNILRRRTALFNTMTDTTLESKIDYIFRRNTWFPYRSTRYSCTTQFERSFNAEFTDHCYLSARLWN